MTFRTVLIKIDTAVNHAWIADYGQYQYKNESQAVEGEILEFGALRVGHAVHGKKGLYSKEHDSEDVGHELATAECQTEDDADGCNDVYSCDHVFSL